MAERNVRKFCILCLRSTLVSTATVTVDDVITQYTTWCPLTTEAPKNGTSTAAPVTSTEAPKNTTSAAPTHSVTSYTGAAAKALPAAGALLAGAAALLL
ncbi:AHL_G0036280.mRNA.1.CDS.1 [Saccharomyces cerevisiae]|nr:AHL_G0036280.mRNA.1.CDS.1 [Saccharomyces cerevisiae]CAI6800909.1 AHL_G0036280.mRNA.1.CDS.1 [Saccharomyces cerevisiae]